MRFCKSYVALFLFIVCVPAYGQKLSPKFSYNARASATEEMTISVSCKDTMLFKQTYADKVKIVYGYAGTGTYTVVTSYAVATEAFVSDSNIRFVDIVQKPVVEAGTDFVNLAFNRVTKVHAAYPALTGEDVRVSIKEERFDNDNIDLKSRWFTTEVTPGTVSQHATTMATIVGGGGNSSSRGLGVVPASRLTSSDFTNLLPDADDIFNTYGIHLQNHSYGVSVENYYGNEAAAYDAQVYAHPDLVHVFSAGNSGGSIPDQGTYAGLAFANLSGNFKQAKNHILVTAVDTTLNVNKANSRGPAYDGRLKPDLTAFGQDGTSDAAALVSGVAAVLQGRYAAVNGVLPTAAVMKAILIASAEDIGPAGIDYTYGYGSVNAYQALHVVDNGQVVEVTPGSMAESTVPITVPANTALLRIAVTWTDAPAAPNSTTALVHDVDAFLTSSEGTWLPWVLRTAPNADSLSAAPRRRKDNLNNVEFITVDNPASGVYMLHVKTPQLTTAQQAVAVAWWSEANTVFQWDYPAASDIVEGGRQTNLFWKQHAATTGMLSLRLNDGAWVNVEAAVDVGQPFHWTPPDTLASATLKMTIGGTDFISDPFVISADEKVSVAYNCDDEFMLTWHAVPGAEDYALFTMGDAYLQKLLTTPDTTITLPKSAGPYFSVAARFNDQTGLKSPAIQYMNQGAFCYINLFEVLRYDAGHVRVNLDLSTWLNIDHVTIYKTAGGERGVFTTFAPGREVGFAWDDAELVPDTMWYQAEVVLANGTVISSDGVPVLIETKGQARLFPNPVPPGAVLNILSEGAGFSVHILDDMGRLMFTQRIADTLDVIDVYSLRAGIYFYQLRQANGTVVYTGKFVKL